MREWYFSKLLVFYKSSMSHYYFLYSRFTRHIYNIIRRICNARTLCYTICKLLNRCPCQTFQDSFAIYSLRWSITVSKPFFLRSTFQPSTVSSSRSIQSVQNSPKAQLCLYIKLEVYMYLYQYIPYKLKIEIFRVSNDIDLAPI